MRDIIPSLLAGLGIFFLGLHLISTSLQESSSRRLRALIRRSTRSVVSSCALGVLAGAVMQSTSAVIVVLGSMVGSGLIVLQQALPIVAFANVGTTALVFVGSFDLRFAVLTLVGLSGIAFSLTSEFRWKSLCSTLLGLGLLLYGGDLITDSASGLQRAAWFDDFVRLGHNIPIALLMGIAASFLSQSTTAAALIAVSLSSAKLASFDESLVMVYGANLGSTLARMAMTRGRTGALVQITRFQDFFKLGATTLFMALFFLELYGHVPLVKALITRITDHVPLELALANLLFNLTMALMTTAGVSRLEGWLRRRWPPNAVEDIGVVRYVSDDAISDPETAIDLLEKEQMRAMTRVRDYLDLMRAATNRARQSDSEAMHRNFLKLFREIEQFYGALLAKHLPATTSERLGNVQGRQKLLEMIEDSVHQLTAAVAEADRGGKIEDVVGDFIEALDFFLLSAEDALRSLDRGDALMLREICSDRSETMGSLRNAYLAPTRDLRQAEKALLLKLTTLFERIVWMLERYAVLLEQNAVAEGIEAPMPASAAPEPPRQPSPEPE